MENEKIEKLRILINDNLVVSYREFEKKAGLTRQTLASVLSGAHNPTVLTVKKICRFFEVDYKEYI